MATKFDIYEKEVRTDIKKFVDSNNSYLPVAYTDRLKTFMGTKFILALHFVDKAGNDFELNASDQFILYGDSDFTHVEKSGASNAAYSGAVVEIVIKTLSAAPTYPTGRLILCNSDYDRDIISYTAYSGSGTGPYTFTVDATLVYTYAEDDTFSVEDALMIYNDNDDVDIAGDWADIDRTTGKISIRGNSSTEPYRAKIAAGKNANGEMDIFVGVRRYISGEATPGQMLLDKAIASDAIGDFEGDAQTTTPTQYTAVQIDALLAAINIASTQVTLTDDDDTDITLGAVATYRGFTVEGCIDDGTYYQKVKLDIIHDGTDAYVVRDYMHDDFETITWAASISGANVLLTATVASHGSNPVFVYKIRTYYNVSV